MERIESLNTEALRVVERMFGCTMALNCVAWSAFYSIEGWLIYEVLQSEANSTSSEAVQLQREATREASFYCTYYWFQPIWIGAPLLLPTMILSRAVARLRGAVNDLRPRLLEQAALADMEAADVEKNLNTLKLVREIETHMQFLNRGRGLGFSVLGVQLNSRVVGTAITAASSAFLTLYRLVSAGQL
eukprot:COSAG02_NODE_1251_length_13599_cov_13.573259_8_plen_188_part_00